jgi:hypothetical protein
LFKTELNTESTRLPQPDPQHLLFQVSALDCTQVFLANPQTLLNILLLLVAVVAELMAAVVEQAACWPLPLFFRLALTPLRLVMEEYLTLTVKTPCSAQ